MKETRRANQEKLIKAFSYSDKEDGLQRPIVYSKNETVDYVRAFAYDEKKHLNSSDENSASYSAQNCAVSNEGIDDEVTDNLSFCDGDIRGASLQENNQQFQNCENLNLKINKVSREQSGVFIQQKTGNIRVNDEVYFVFDDNYLWAIQGDKRVQIGNLCLKIEAEISQLSEVVDTNNVIIDMQKDVLWEISAFTNGRYFKSRVWNKNLSGDTWVAELTTNRAYIDERQETKRLFKRYINSLVIKEDFKKVTEYKSTGWKKLGDGRWYYMTNIGVIGYPEIPITSNPDKKFICKWSKIGAKSVFDDFMSMRGIIHNKIENAVVLQHFLCLSVMTRLYQEAGFPIKFSLALVGKTNTRKTSCGMVFTKLFNRTQKGVCDINFTSTKIAILEVLETYSDAIVMVDDLTPSEDEKAEKEQADKLELIVRAYGDRVPRKRSVTFSKESGTKEFTAVNGCCLITGEVFSGSKSSRSRVIQLEFEDTDVDNRNLSFFQDNLWIVPTFIYDFICFITENIETALECIKTEVKNARTNQENHFQTPRLKEATGVFKATVRLFYWYALQRGFIGEDVVNAQVEFDMNCICQVIGLNDEKLQTCSPGARVIESIKYFLEKGNLKAVKLSNGKLECSVTKTNGIIIEDDVTYYVRAETVWECARNYADVHRIYFPYKNGREIVTLLKNENLLVCKMEGRSNRSTHKLSLSNQTLNERFLYIKKDMAHKLWESNSKF